MSTTTTKTTSFSASPISFNGDNDIMILTNKNIVSSITDANNLPLCAIASYKMVEDISSATSSAIGRIDEISSNINNITLNADLSNNYGLSIITNIAQNAGIISVKGKELLSADIKDLPEYANNVQTSINTITTNIDTISSTYALSADVPLSTSDLINNGDGHNNVFMLNDKLTLQAGYGAGSNDYNLCLLYDNSCVASLIANDFVKDSFLSSVQLCGDGLASYLNFTWITQNPDDTHETQLATNEVYLSTLVNNLYEGIDGIDVNNFTISVDYAKVAALSIVNKLCADFANISSDMNNIITYSGHITIDNNDNLSSISAILANENLTHGTQLGQLRNGSMYEVSWRNITELSTDEAKASAYITTTDGITLHHKDVIIVHQHDNNKQYIDADDSNLSSYIKVITAVDWPLFYSLCCAVDNSYVWLSGGNSIINAHAISGDNDYVGVNRFEAISANNLSIDLSNLVNTNISSSINYVNVQSFIEKTELSIDQLSTMLSNKIVINGISLGTINLNINHISQDDYYDLIKNGETLSNVLYIVSSDNWNIYNERIINLANGLSASDATNVGQVTLSIDSETERATIAENYLSLAISSETERATIAENYLSLAISSETERATTAENYLSLAIDTKIYVNDETINSLSINTISQDDYHQLVFDTDGDLPISVLYVVSSDNFNMYGGRITNVATPIDLSDAVNKEYVDNISTALSTNLTTNMYAINTSLSNALSTTITTALSIGGLTNASELSDIDVSTAISVVYGLLQVAKSYNWL